MHVLTTSIKKISKDENNEWKLAFTLLSKVDLSVRPKSEKVKMKLRDEVNF